MSEKTGIEWTTSTWNPVTGCTEVSPGCKNCYAKTFAERFRGVKDHPYEQGFDLKLWPDRLEIPLKWKKPRRIFVNSMSDLFHEDVPDEFIYDVFAVMTAATQHTFQILTKRPARMMQWVNYHVTLHKTATAPRNVWLGVSCEDQKRADERIPLLLQTPAAVHFISCEPLLGLIDLKFPKEPNPNPGDTWVIVGGESGPGARPCRIGWIRDIIRQCGEVNVPVFVKQLGAHPFWMDGEGRHELKLNDRKGGDMREWPDSDLKVRQYPMEAK